MQRPESDYRFFYVRSEPSAAERQAFELVRHKPHKREPLGFPVGCVAYTITDETDEYRTIHFAFSTHNPGSKRRKGDTYSRDAAKGWALYFLLVKPKNRGSVPWEERGIVNKANIMTILALPSSPIRVQKAARYWLSRYRKPSEVDAPPNPSVSQQIREHVLRGGSVADFRPQLVGRKAKRGSARRSKGNRGSA